MVDWILNTDLLIFSIENISFVFFRFFIDFEYV